VNSNEAKGRQLGGQALYLFDDENDSWAQTASASSCEDLVKYAKNITSLNGTATAMIIPLFGQPPRVEDIYIDLNLKPRWWYVGIGHCGAPVDANYDIEFLQADGSQFGFDKKGLLGLYIFFFVVYLVGFLAYAIQVVRHKDKNHGMVKAFTIVNALQVIAKLCEIIHLAKYGSVGEGIPFFDVMSTLLEEGSILMLIIMCLAVASGWNVKPDKTKFRFVPLAALYSGLTIIVVIYYHATMGKSWATNFVYDQWPGVVLMIGRLVVAALFCALLRPTFVLERAADKRAFYRWFGVLMATWLCAIPFLVFVCEAIVSYWQVRVTEGLVLLIDSAVLALLSLLLRPSRMASMFPANNNFQETFITGIGAADAGSYVPPDML